MFQLQLEKIAERCWFTNVDEQNVNLLIQRLPWLLTHCAMGSVAPQQLPTELVKCTSLLLVQGKKAVILIINTCPSV